MQLGVNCGSPRMLSPPCSPYWEKPGGTLGLDQAGAGGRYSLMLAPSSPSELPAGGKMAPICAE